MYGVSNKYKCHLRCILLFLCSIVIRTDNAKALLQSAYSSSNLVQLLKKALSPGVWFIGANGVLYNNNAGSSISLQFFYDVAESQSSNLEALVRG